MHLPIIDTLLFWKPLGYLIIFISVALEGDVTLYGVSIITFERLLNLKFVLPIVFLAAFSSDLVCYWIGYRLDWTQNWISRSLNKLSRPIDEQLKKRPFKTILLTKFAYGLHHATLIRAGNLKMPLKQYIKVDFISSAIWIVSIGLLGYFTQASFGLVRQYIKYAETALFAGLLGFFLLWYILSRIIRKGL